ncbi:ABC-2 type transport system permease protein [Hydrogenispora ethanolica]|uniref:Transport permease protein n=1 Tax=Hydrogenispora ethanolica TaxID=1082276 RepID=A0A4V2QC23_HYDET|nr:ABC transporter permease [Hydrogenispora ethanolica]TCL58617.1 ABC-2 type transport system permease protein [Hydrogenispora ethanolica]
MNTLQRLAGVMKKEFLHITRDNILFMIAFVAPLALTLLCGFLYIQQKVTNLPVVIFDQDQSEMSRMITRAFGDSERLKIVGAVDTYAQLEQALQSERAIMGVVIPPHLQSDLKNVRGAEVGLVINSSNILTMNTVASAASSVVATIGAGVTMKVIQGLGMSPPKAYQAVTALSFRTRNWYNPTLSYLVFMLAGLIGTVLQQVTFLGVALSFVKEKEQGTWRQLSLSKLRVGELIGGKLLVYFMIYALDALIMYGLCFGYFQVPLRGDPWLLLLTVALFIVVLVAVGMAISVLAQNMPQAIEISMLIAVPSFLISGYTWPYLSMPPVIQVLSRLLPLSHFVEAVRAIAIMGAGWNVVWPKLAILAVFALISLPLTYWMVRRTMTRA